MAEIANPVGNTFTANVRVVSAPEKRKAGQKDVLEFRVANKTQFREAPAFFFSITLWTEKEQEMFANLRKGEIISVSGTLNVREWVDKKTEATRQAFSLDRANISRLERREAQPSTESPIAPDDQGDDPLAGI